MYRAMCRRVFEFPDWVSKSAKKVIYRLLDPNPFTRLSLDDLINLTLFKKSFSQENLSSIVEPEFLEFKHLPKVNAFDIISMSSGLNLFGLFENEVNNKEIWFLTRGMNDVVEIEEKVVKVGVGLGSTPVGVAADWGRVSLGFGFFDPTPALVPCRKYGKNGLLKISDFCLSALSDQKINNSPNYTVCGTPAYTVPEVINLKGYDGKKADSWSCGVLLYVFLVGRLPFDDSNLSFMYHAMFRRVFEFPDWVSKSAKKVIYRLLDPKNLSSIVEPEFLEFKHLPKVNAFDIISMSSGLNLSGLFENEVNNKEIRFLTRGMNDVVEIEEKVVKVGVGLGYKVELGKSGGMRMVKGRVVLVIQIFEVAVQMWLVELKLVDGVMEFGDLQWEELKNGLGDIVLTWQKEVS
ncbi:CBL-interacting serine/threonine-protein kinase 7 [Castilleja foliolosa]|uniref:non-specific serine/threonine protein kinase n=1 Tax=Castilleja foliolosa TaxID=1961234 RepID=A0ABD3DBB9_9LAMI